MPNSTSTNYKIPQAYLLLVMRRLTDSLLQDGDGYAKEKSLPWPARMNSVVSIIAQAESISAGQISKYLGYSPQLIAQNLKFLKKIDVIQSLPGQNDKRSKLISLTQNGQHHYQNLQLLEDIADEVFEDIFEDMGVNMHTLLLKFESYFEQSSLLERLHKIIEAREDS